MLNRLLFLLEIFSQSSLSETRDTAVIFLYNSCCRRMSFSFCPIQRFSRKAALVKSKMPQQKFLSAFRTHIFFFTSSDRQRPKNVNISFAVPAGSRMLGTMLRKRSRSTSVLCLGCLTSLENPKHTFKTSCKVSDFLTGCDQDWDQLFVSLTNFHVSQIFSSYQQAIL